MRVRIQPYRAGSVSARELSSAIGHPRVRLVRTRFRPRRGDVVINWGSGSTLFPEEYYLNKPSKVELASNKLHSYGAMKNEGVPVPGFTTDIGIAQEWAAEPGQQVLCRTLLRASEGRGIVLVDRPQDVVRAPLYTMYVKKRDEYRVHVVDGAVIHIQQKRRSRSHENPDPRIRNTQNGWVFCIQQVEAPQAVSAAARQAIHSLGLDFGAADVGYNHHYRSAAVYEVNTAPGLEGTTISRYAESLSRLAEDRGAPRPA